MTGPRRPSRAEPGGKQKLRLWLRLLRVARTIEVELRRRFALQFATTLPKFDVMAALARADKLRPLHQPPGTPADVPGLLRRPDARDA